MSKEFEYLRVDDRGRIVIPSHIRRFFGIGKYNRLVLSKDENGFKITPFLNKNNIAFDIVLKDVPGSLAAVTATIAKNNINIVLSEAKPIKEGRTARCFLVLNGENGSLKDIQKKISELEVVKKIETV